MILWLTGNSGVGKSTLGRILRYRLGAILLDGDEMRHAISEKAGFSKKDREEHNLRVARLAKVLVNQDFNVIVSVIAPFQETRDKIDDVLNPVKICWIYVKRKKDLDNLDIDKPYEIPKNPDIVVDVDKLSVDESVELIYRKIRK